MSHPLCAIGSAVLEVVGLNPRTRDEKEQANWPSKNVFGDEPFIQPTGLGERREDIKLATRPHVMGGLGAYAALQRHLRSQDVVPYLRLYGVAAPFPLGRLVGMVAVEALSHQEDKIAPDGLGWRHEFTATLLYVGRRAGGF